jgi:hypothetical protein
LGSSGTSYIHKTSSAVTNAANIIRDDLNLSAFRLYGTRDFTGPRGDMDSSREKGDKGYPCADSIVPKHVGEKGDPGTVGAAGTMGDKGDPGATGETGSASTVPGPKGDKGDTDATGATGVAGPAVAPGVTCPTNS